MTSQPTALRDDHQPEAVRERLARPHQPSYLGDAVLGGIDGCVTTFAVVAGAVGGGFSYVVILVLGFANLLADGLSMAVGNYLGTKSQHEELEKARLDEERQIELDPEGEREEVRQVFRAKGFDGDLLDGVVDVITANRQLWVNTMLTEELGLRLESPNPLKAGAMTFVAFLVVGTVPLLPFLVFLLDQSQAFAVSAVATAFSFATIGAIKGRLTARSVLRSSLETLLTGGVAAIAAYLVGTWLRGAFGAA